MDKEQLLQARINPDFLNYLENTRVDAIKTKNISALYEVLDSFLILDLEEEKVNDIYQNILKISFENVQKIIDDNKKLSLNGDELFFVRAFYEHGIEKWSQGDFKGAKELLFVLSNIIEDDLLIKSLQSHLIAIIKELDLDSFYENEVNLDSVDLDERHAYFITSFKYDIKNHLDLNKELLEKEYENLQDLLDK